MAHDSRTRLVLLRHGQTDWNTSGRFQGQEDIPLNETGLQQARRVAPLIASLHPTALYCSPLGRARQTISPVADILDLPVTYDDRLREISVGSWAGLTLDDMSRIDPAFQLALKAGQDYRRSPTGETSSEVGVRVAEGLADIAAQHEGQTTLIASHGLAIRMGTGVLLGFDFDHAWRLGAMTNCGWTILEERSDGWHLACYNRSALQIVMPEQVEGEGA